MYRSASSAAAQPVPAAVIGLPVGVVDEVAGGEDAGEVGPRARRVDQHVALVVQVDLAAEQFAARVVADRHEDAGDVERRSSPVTHVADPDAGDLAVVAEDLGRRRVFHSTLIFGLASARSAMILLARNSSRRWMIVTVSAKRVRKRGLLHRRVAAADDHDVLVAEEEAVAGGAGRDAVAEQLLLARARPAAARPSRWRG